MPSGPWVLIGRRAKRNRKPTNRKVSTEVHEKLDRGDCWYEGLSHMQLFGELISRGPTMHGPPQKKSK